MEVLCSGLNVVDLLVSAPAHVPYGQKTECENIVVQGGAPAGNAACGLAALGHETGFLGHFGDNTLSRIAKAEFRRWGVKDDFFIRKDGAVPAIAIVQIDTCGERTVLYSMKDYVPCQPDEVDESIMNECRLLLVDGYDTVINTHLLRLAKTQGVQSVLDMEKAETGIMKDMVALASHAVLPLEGAQQLCGKTDIKTCARAVDGMTEGQVVITDGANGAYAVFDERIVHQPAYKVNVVDTTGCGDAFHAAYASALLQGMDVPNCMKYGSFFAAQVAQEFGGRTRFPTREYMNRHLHGNMPEQLRTDC